MATPSMALSLRGTVVDTAAAAECSGASTKLPADQCAAWQSFWDDAGGDKGWTRFGAGCTRNDPCAPSCHDISSIGTSRGVICNSAGTAITKMCVTARAPRSSPPRSQRRARQHDPAIAARCC